MLFLLAVGIALRLRWAGPADVADLFPPPDAVQYDTAAANLAAGRGYVLDVDGAIYPPRYPPGFPLLMVLGSPLTGTPVGFGIRTVQVLSAASILVAALLAFRAAGPWAGAATASILAVSGTHVEYSWFVMSDVPSAGLCALVGAWGLGAQRRGSSRLEALALGFAAAALALVRTSNVVILLPLLLVALAEPKTRRDFRWIASLCAGMAIGLALVPLDRWWRFGSPFEDGYTFWVGDKVHSYDLTRYNYFAPSRHPKLGGPANLPRYLAVLAGDGPLWAWPVGILLAVGLATSIGSRDDDTRRLGRFTAALLVAVLAFFGAYYWQSERFLLPAVPFAAAVAGIPIGLASPRWARPAGLALLALSVTLSLATYGPWLDAARLHRRTSTAGMLAAVDRVAPRDAVVFAPGNPFLVDRMLRMPAHDLAGPTISDRRFVALGASWFQVETHPSWRAEILPTHLRPSKGWMLGTLRRPEDRAATAASIASALDSGRPAVLAEPDMQRLWTGLRGGRPAPELAGFDFREVARSPGFAVYAVTRAQVGGVAAPAAPGPH